MAVLQRIRDKSRRNTLPASRRATLVHDVLIADVAR